MLKAINLNGKIKNYKFDKNSSVLKPFIISKRVKKNSDKKEDITEFVDIKNAVNMKNSKYLEVIVDDFGLKIIDNEEKGFCIEWEKLDVIRDLNDFLFLEEDTEEENDKKEQKMDEFIDAVFNVVLEEINKDK